MAGEYCKNCNAELGGNDHFCRHCGQAAVDSRDRSLASLLRASFEEATSIDSRLWQSMRLLLFRPGRLSLDYREGRRRRYLSPIGIFLLGNLLFFLAPPLTDFQLSLEDQYELQPYSAWTAKWVDAYLAASGKAFDDVANAYQLRVIELAKLMVIVHVPLLAAGTMLLAPDKRLYYADHIVMGLHYFAFLMIYLLLVSAVFWLLSAVAPSALRAGPHLALLAFLIHFLYVPVMLRTTLGLSVWRALISVPLFVLALFIAHFIYRFVQFVVAFALIGI